MPCDEISPTVSDLLAPKGRFDRSTLVLSHPLLTGRQPCALCQETSTDPLHPRDCQDRAPGWPPRRTPATRPMVPR
jgi:hypothetical protein